MVGGRDAIQRPQKGTICWRSGRLLDGLVFVNRSTTLRGALSSKNSLRFRLVSAAADALRGKRSISYAMSAASTSLGLAAMAFPSSVTVEHCEVGPFASERRHKVRRIAEQCDPGYAVPTVLDRERVDRARHRAGLTVGDERCQLRGPAVEFLGDAGQGSHRVGEVDAGNPILRFVQAA
jgi:hypothetical protein